MEIAAKAARKPFYSVLYVQVLIGIVLGAVLGWLAPELGTDLRPLGDVFHQADPHDHRIGHLRYGRLRHRGMSDMKKMGRLGAKALLYFEVVSTLALLLGVVIGNVVNPGGGFNADVSKLNTAAIARYAGQAKEHGTVDFLMNIVPNTVIDGFARGDILPIVFVAVLFGVVLSKMGERGKVIRDLVNAMSELVFGIINVLMRVAPIGAFGAMAYTVGNFGVGLPGGAWQG